MTMKPEFSKPFDIEHAKAGAPIANRMGDTAHFVAHVPEANPNSRIIVRFDNGEIGTRHESGKHYSGGEQVPGDIVMLPLGLIDGKPVFVGDTIADTCGNTLAAFVGVELRDGHYWSWPTPAREYPETGMNAAQLSESSNGMVVGHGCYLSYRNVANAAIRHAIDSGQVITMEDRAARDMEVARAVEDVYCKLVPHKRRNSDSYIRNIIATIK